MSFPLDTSNPAITMVQTEYRGEAGGAATTFYCGYRVPRKSFLRGVQFVVTTAGVGAGHKFEVYVTPVATGSAGKESEKTLGTGAAGTVSDLLYTTDVVLEKGDLVQVKSAADTTGKADVTYFIQPHFNASLTGTL